MNMREMMKPHQLAILILTIPNRKEFLARLFEVLLPQCTETVTILTDDRPLLTKAAKRNFLLDQGTRIADYVAFVDDDDLVDKDYIELLMRGINKGVDCCSLSGVITDDGFDPRLFQHSIRFNEYKTVTEKGITRYERYPNHLNCIKSEIARRFEFPETKHRFGDADHGEDTEWATLIHESGLLETEHWIDEIIYYYEHRNKKPELA